MALKTTHRIIVVEVLLEWTKGGPHQLRYDYFYVEAVVYASGCLSKEDIREVSLRDL